MCGIVRVYNYRGVWGMVPQGKFEFLGYGGSI